MRPSIRGKLWNSLRTSFSADLRTTWSARCGSHRHHCWRIRRRNKRYFPAKPPQEELDKLRRSGKAERTQNEANRNQPPPQELANRRCRIRHRRAHPETETEFSRPGPQPCVPGKKWLEQSKEQKADSHSVTAQRNDEDQKAFYPGRRPAQRGPQEHQRRDAMLRLLHQQPSAILLGQLVGWSKSGENRFHAGPWIAAAFADVHPDFLHDVLALSQSHAGQSCAQPRQIVVHLLVAGCHKARSVSLSFRTGSIRKPRPAENSVHVSAMRVARSRPFCVNS